MLFHFLVVRSHIQLDWNRQKDVDGFVININGAETHFLLCLLSKMVSMRMAITLTQEKYVKIESCAIGNLQNKKDEQKRRKHHQKNGLEILISE